MITVLLLKALSSHQQKSCYLQAGELITAPENFCFGRGDGLYLPCREESRNASLPAGLDRAASPQPRCTLAPWQGFALGVQAELARGTHTLPWCLEAGWQTTALQPSCPRKPQK